MVVVDLNSGVSLDGSKLTVTPKGCRCSLSHRLAVNADVPNGDRHFWLNSPTQSLEGVSEMEKSS